MIGDRLFGYKERYYEKCKVCSSTIEVIHLPLYVYGSEGVELCRDCRMILTELVKGMIRIAFNSRKWQRLIKDQKIRRINNDMNIADICIGRAKKYNHYQHQGRLSLHSCATCLRRQISYPYTCIDGWPMGRADWIDRGSTCLNWSNDPKARVD